MQSYFTQYGGPLSTLYRLFKNLFLQLMGYLYRGFYKKNGQTVEANIQVSYYRGEAKSVLGHLSKFQLNLSGKASDDAFTVSGHVFGQSQLAITVEGQKQADLIA
jgi:hypothetical protein